MNLFFLATFPDPNRPESPRGGYRRNMETVRLLATQFDVQLIISANAPFMITAPDGVEATFVAQKSMPLRWLKLFWYLLRHCPRTTPLICYNPSLHTFPMLWLKWLGWRVIVDYVDLQGTIVESKRPLLRRLSKWIEKRFIHSCHEFITSSIQIANRIRQHNPHAAIFILRGTFYYQENLNPASPLALPESSASNINIMYLGMMQPFSGVIELLNAFVQTAPPHANLFLVGQGPSKTICEELAHQHQDTRKIFFPSLDDEALHPFMHKMDILTVLYLDNERNKYNFPSKIIEYLWAGKAILGTKVGEIEQALEHDNTAWLVDPDEASLKIGLTCLIADKDLRKKLGNQARKEFETNYHPDVVASALTQFIQGSRTLNA